jgi:hypothetical protein
MILAQHCPDIYFTRIFEVAFCTSSESVATHGAVVPVLVTGSVIRLDSGEVNEKRIGGLLV